MSIFVILGLLVCMEAPGSSAVTPVFVKKGDDLLLNVTEADVPENFVFVVWNFRENILVTFSLEGKPTVSDAYTGRVETSVKKFSVKLKNLQEADSGVYTAEVIAQKVQTLAEYDVTVPAPVSPVGLTVDSVSDSSDSCNLSVTCSTQDSHISSTFTCDTQTCSQEGGERSEVTTSGASLHVYLLNDSIICNHSNQVSWTKNMMNIQQPCIDDGLIQPRNHVITSVNVTVGVLVVIILIICGVFKCQQRGTDQRENNGNTIYAVPDAVPMQSNHSPHEMGATAQPADPTNDASGPSPASEYSLVGLHSGSTETRGNTESLYAQIDNVGRA